MAATESVTVGVVQVMMLFVLIADKVAVGATVSSAMEPVSTVLLHPFALSVITTLYVPAWFTTTVAALEGPVIPVPVQL